VSPPYHKRLIEVDLPIGEAKEFAQELRAWGAKRDYTFL
jgi:hypothetical protein